METIVKAVTDIWILCFGISSAGLYADNGEEFVNMKIDELIARLGVTVRYGPAYSLWSNSINERNHTSCDITIKKLMEEMKVMLNDFLVKGAPWTHNKNINKFGLTPLQLMTGKSYNLPGFAIGSETLESVMETEAMQNMMERILKTQAEFREANRKMKLKD